jgi:hypothetical protein
LPAFLTHLTRLNYDDDHILYFITLLFYSNLTQPVIFELDGRWMARWSDCYKRIISQARKQLQGELKGKLSKRCIHVKSHGGVKKSIRLLVRAILILN